MRIACRNDTEGLFAVLDEDGFAALLDCHQDDDCEDGREEDDARGGGAEAEALAGAGVGVRRDLTGLREQVADGRTEWAGENVRGPEPEDGIELELPMK